MPAPAKPIIYLLRPRTTLASSFELNGLAANLNEEGYQVLQIDTLQAIRAGQDVGLITFDFDEGTIPQNVVVAVHYSPGLDNDFNTALTTPTTVVHLREDQLETWKRGVAPHGQTAHLVRPFDPAQPAPQPRYGPVHPRGVKTYVYPRVHQGHSPHWAVCLPFSHHTRDIAFQPSVTEWMRSAAGMSYTRTLDTLKSALGPRWDLESLWEQHTYYEFATRDSTATMATMVDHPYVNHIATMTGGAGYDDLLHFYTNNFVTRSPPDTELIPISRTVGSDRIVDEMVFRCTHTTEIDYFLPGIEPTGRPVSIPMVGIVAFRGGKLAFESLYWDQASTLAQGEQSRTVAIIRLFINILSTAHPPVGILDPDRIPAIAGSQVARKGQR